MSTFCLLLLGPEKDEVRVDNTRCQGQPNQRSTANRNLTEAEPLPQRTAFDKGFNREPDCIATKSTNRSRDGRCRMELKSLTLDEFAVNSDAVDIDQHLSTEQEELANHTASKIAQACGHRAEIVHVVSVCLGSFT